MEVKAKAKFIKMGPRKVRLITDICRGKKATEAIAMLAFIPNYAAVPVACVIKNALSIAKTREMDEEKVIVSEIFCDEGPRLKRGIRAGRHHWRPINKQMSHVTVILTEEKEKVQPKAKIKKAEKIKTADTKELKIKSEGENGSKD